MIRFNGLPVGVSALMTTRLGGHSTGLYDGLNLGTHVGDDPQTVFQNRAELALATGCPVAYLDQVHGTDVVTRVEADTTPSADAQSTLCSGLALHIGVADCLPVAFAQKDGQKIAAAHAGWRGLLNGILENTAATLSDSVAVLGPCIGPLKFQVGGEVREAFLSSNSGLSRFFKADVDGRYLCDLRGIAHTHLAMLGIEVVDEISECTVTESDRWFSYRREPPGGRMGLVIWRSN